MSRFYNFYLDDVDKNPFLEREMQTVEIPTFAQSKDKLPRPMWEGHADAVEAYYKAWEIAFGNLGNPTEENGFVSPYIDAAFNGDIFMWDSCFMLMFGKYGDAVFPFQKTLDNFYCKQCGDGYIGRQYHEDNGGNRFEDMELYSTGPEIMAWCEWEYYKNFGDKKRLEDIYFPLLCYHRWLKMYHRRMDGSYWATGLGCGMDNAPRYDGSVAPFVDPDELRPFHHSWMAWIDANLQAVISCKYLIKMAEEIGVTDGVAELQEEIDFLTDYINNKMWSDEDAYYYDLKVNGELLRTKTIASYWALLADIIPADRLEKFIAHLENENEFKRPHRVPTLSADHPDYAEDGMYWNGSVWAPTNYMVLRGLTTNGKHDLAYEIAKNHHENMMAVYKDTGTFWENYAPEKKLPGSPAGKDFVGWTGLIPISVFIEYVLGIQVHAEKKEIVWYVRNLESHGICNLPVGNGCCVDLLCEARKDANEKPVVTLTGCDDITVTVVYDGGTFTL